MEELYKKYKIKNVMDRYFANILNENGYETIGDLTETKAEDVMKSFDFYFGFSCVRAFIHNQYGFTFKDEYKDIGLDNKTAFISIDDLEITNGIKVILKRNAYIYTLGELLTTPFDNIMLCRQMSEAKMLEIKEYIHSLGYKLQNEHLFASEIVDNLRTEGKVPLEDYGFTPNVYNILYRNGIYTLDDLYQRKGEIVNFKNFGPLREQELNDILNNIDVSNVNMDNIAKKR